MSDDEDLEEQEGAAGRARTPDLAPPCARRVADSPHEASPSVRRDENSFSLRHFLRGDSSASGAYERMGARPKTYGARSPERAERRGGGVAEPLGLPDFVQDHLLEPGARRAAGPGALSAHPPHLSLDLTESVPRDRPPPSPHTFPLDLPVSAGGGSGGGLPDFLPAHPGRASPAPSDQLQRLNSQLEQLTAELAEQRARCGRLERELQLTRDAAGSRAPPPPFPGDDAASVCQLRAELHRLRESESSARREADELRARQAAAARALRLATAAADTSLRELLAGLGRLRDVSSSLEPP